jgi:hypothetical protein
MLNLAEHGILCHPFLYINSETDGAVPSEYRAPWIYADEDWRKNVEKQSFHVLD